MGYIPKLQKFGRNSGKFSQCASVKAKYFTRKDPTRYLGIYFRQARRNVFKLGEDTANSNKGAYPKKVTRGPLGYFGRLW